MMPNARPLSSWIAIVLASLALMACSFGSDDYRAPPAPGPTGEQKVGDPYRIGGIWYYPRDDQHYDDVGIASWYGPRFHGRPTANGERFDMNRLTAAHPTLPLPSNVRVTNLENGRVVTVRVNDRGPFARGRIIDLSRRAAQLLGFEKNGTARVRVQVVRRDGSIADRNRRDAVRLAEGETPAGPLFVQVGSFADYSNARRIHGRLTDLGEIAIQPATADGRTVYRVRIGPFDDHDAARRVLDRVYERGFYEARIFTDRLS